MKSEWGRQLNPWQHANVGGVAAPMGVIATFNIAKRMPAATGAATKRRKSRRRTSRWRPHLSCAHLPVLHRVPDIYFSLAFGLCSQIKKRFFSLACSSFCCVFCLIFPQFSLHIFILISLAISLFTARLFRWV